MNVKRLKAILILFVVSCCAGGLRAQGNPGYVAREDGAWLHYLEVGKDNPGPVNLLFVPGWTMPDWIWTPQLEAFKGEFRAVAMSPRSQGQSSKENDGHHPRALAGDIKSVIDHLGLKRVVLVAWSQGVFPAVAFVERYGTADLTGLVLVDGLPGLDPGASSAQMLAMTRNLQMDRVTFTRNFVTSMFRSQRSQDYLNRLTRAALDTPTNTAVTLALTSLNFDFRGSLGKIDVPTLIAVAGDEESPYWSGFQAMKEAIAGARMEVFREAGHALFVDESDRFNQLLRDFMGQIATSGR